MRVMIAAASAALGAMLHSGPVTAQIGAAPETLQFQSLDGTILVGYLFRPQGQRDRSPAVVLMHGRAGAYSSLARGRYDAATLTQRHKFWGQYWASQGYAALMVDGFGPRGYPTGFPRFSYQDRPDAVNEVTVRPLDAYGALRYLRTRADIDGQKIALMGWSNGGSATIAAMSDVVLAANGFRPGEGFRGGLSFYPACGLHNRFDRRYIPHAPIQVFAGEADEEVSATRCERFARASQMQGGAINIAIYPGATHSFDDPGARRQSNPANFSATQASISGATEFLRAVFAN